jgi:hypothetical protein
MNVTFLTDVEIGSQAYFVCKALNEHTSIKARAITFANNKIDHFVDHWIGYGLGPQGQAVAMLPESDIVKRWEQAKEIIENTDFFIFRRDYHDYFMRYMKKPITPFNNIMVVYGSECRENPAFYWWLSEKQNVTIVSSHDYTNSSVTGFSAQHMPISLDMSILPPHKFFKNNTPLKICHAPTNRSKKLTDVFLKVTKQLPVETVLIEGMNWKDCLQAKNGCDISFDQIYIGSYGMSSVESMALCQVSLAYINRWVKSMYPNLPVVNVTADTLFDVVSELIKDEQRITDIKAKGYNFVKEYHSLKATAPRWENLIKFVSEEKRIIG